LTFTTTRHDRDWSASIVQQFELVAQILANALARRQADHLLREQLGEIRRLKHQLEQENTYLRDEIMLQYGLSECSSGRNRIGVHRTQQPFLPGASPHHRRSPLHFAGASKGAIPIGEALMMGEQVW
jgi:GAF domain-containing protein